MELFKIQTKLMAEHPQLKQKRLVLQYYVSIECTEKQRKIVNWWNCMIQSAVRVSCEIFLSPADLENVFCLHGLKPVPLVAVLDDLQKNEKIEWRNKDKIIDPDVKQNKSLLRRIIGVLFPQKSTKQKLSRYTSLQSQKNSQILSVNLLSQKIGRIKQIIETQMEHDHNISYDYIMQKVKQKTNLTIKAIGFLIQELENKGWIAVEEVGGKKVIIFSQNGADYNNKKWVQAQKQKFILNYNINAMQTKIDMKLKQQNQKLQLAKSVMQRDKSKAKIYLAQALNIKKSRQAFQTRNRVLQDSLSQLQMNEQNFKLTEIMAQTQKVIQQSQIDPSQLDTIKQKNMEIQMQQKQVSDGFEQLNNIGKDDDQDDLVNEMMKELTDDIKKSRLNKNKQNKQNSSHKFVSNSNFDDQFQKQLFSL